METETRAKGWFGLREGTAQGDAFGARPGAVESRGDIAEVVVQDAPLEAAIFRLPEIGIFRPV